MDEPCFWVGTSGPTQCAFEGVSNLDLNHCMGGVSQEIPMPETGVEMADHT